MKMMQNFFTPILYCQLHRYIFVMLVERQVGTTTPKCQSEISEHLCFKNMDLNNYVSKVVGPLRF